MGSDKRQRAIRAAIGVLIPLAVAAGLVVVAPPGVYLWLKALHIACAVAWIGGLLGLTYLLTWHAREAEPGAAATLFQVENQLLRKIVNPAMVLAWGIGLWLAWDAGWYVGRWLQVKLVLVLALSALHGWVVGAVRAGGSGMAQRSTRTFRDITIGAALVAVTVIVLAVVKPM